MNTPFLDAIAKLSNKNTRFFVPGHKGHVGAIPFMKGIERLDFTEIEGADDLSNPSGPLAESQQNMTKAYQSGATLYSASGSSSCIQAMITLFVGQNKPVVIARNCHVSAVRAIAFLGAKPTWVLLENGVPTADNIQKALFHSKAKAVYITSPDYYGHMADIPAISAVCKKMGAALLVDNAHGAYLHFLKSSQHPLHLGADCTCDSAHKTLPCLTPAALLHLKNSDLAALARQSLNLYSSTSPSYLVLQSLDYAAGLLLANSIDFSNCALQVAEIAFDFSYLAEPVEEPLKLCICPPKAGWQTTQMLAKLASAGILPEFSDENYIVLMASPYNQPQDFVLLRSVLTQFPQKKRLLISYKEYTLPKQTVSIRDALLGEKKLLPIEHTVGRICASLAVPCPPGMPIALPGEVISREIAKQYASGGILQLDVLK